MTVLNNDKLDQNNIFKNQRILCTS